MCFPLCGTDSGKLKSSITPFLSGDIKIDKNHYLTKPVSREDLRQPVRNFFVATGNGHIFSLAQSASTENDRIEAGPLWHKVVRSYPQAGLELEALNFIPTTGEQVELMRVTVRNTSDQEVVLTPTAALPIFGRALVNKHDHEHVTSLLNRIQQLPDGVLVKPTLFFNEEGHLENHAVYYVFGTSDIQEKPVGTFPTVPAFYGDAGDGFQPEAILKKFPPRQLSSAELAGKETMGALRFKEERLAAGASKEYILVFGIARDRADAEKTFVQFNSLEKWSRALENNKAFWQEKSHAIRFQSGDEDLDSWLKWVALQPVFRRIFGNSFLPDHDYGKGGKGWRDIWQDLLSLILLEPQQVRGSLINNFAGVRIDGTNATIIGSKPGEFIADRNMITRVWMDHGVWPLLTTELYIDQTGDFDLLLEEQTYFRDPQQSRTFARDTSWSAAYGQRLKTKKGKEYRGTIIEHLLVQHLVQFFNVGEHNVIRLESADWNDGMDMAFERGECVAFMSFYGGNLFALADLLTDFSKKTGTKKIRLVKELLILLDSLSGKGCDYNSIEEKKALLFKKYFKAVQPEVSGQQSLVDIAEIVKDLRKKGRWIFQWVNKKEWVAVQDGGETFSWINGYYDNQAKRVEGLQDGRVWMTLTGQVFPLMSGLVKEEQVAEVVKSVNRFLRDPQWGGVRLNTDFGLDRYLDLGRAFGFAYGTKENGAFFSHMNVMYAYALYRRGFAKEGRAVLKSIYQMSTDTEHSKILPGVPEYFDSLGQGMYPYLTGSASWFILTQLTKVFGVRGERGDLVLAPQLTAGEFDKNGEAKVQCQFAGKNLTVIYGNRDRRDFGQYAIQTVTLNNQPLAEATSGSQIKIKRQTLEKFPSEIQIHVTLAGC